jgi:hypothetical protein
MRSLLTQSKKKNKAKSIQIRVQKCYTIKAPLQSIKSVFNQVFVFANPSVIRIPL